MGGEPAQETGEQVGVNTDQSAVAKSRLEWTGDERRRRRDERRRRAFTRRRAIQNDRPTVVDQPDRDDKRAPPCVAERRVIDGRFGPDFFLAGSGSRSSSRARLSWVTPVRRRARGIGRGSVFAVPAAHSRARSTPSTHAPRSFVRVTRRRDTRAVVTFTPSRRPRARTGSPVSAPRGKGTATRSPQAADPRRAVSLLRARLLPVNPAPAFAFPSTP